MAISQPSAKVTDTERGVWVEGLNFTYKAGDRVVEALRDINLETAPSSFNCLLGRSGCGKTTLLNILAGFLNPRQGRITVNNVPLSKLPPFSRGMVFQEYALFPWLTVQRNITFGLENKGVATKVRAEVGRHLMELVELSEFAEAYPHTLSGGMRQRVAIARALACEPSLLLMDEPFGALDSFTRDRLLRLLLKVWTETRPTVFYVTHNVREAVYLADEVIVMTPRPGVIKEIVPIRLPRPRSPLSRDFVAIEKRLESLVGLDEEIG